MIFSNTPIPGGNLSENRVQEFVVGDNLPLNASGADQVRPHVWRRAAGAGPDDPLERVLSDGVIPGPADRHHAPKEVASKSSSWPLDRAIASAADSDGGCDECGFNVCQCA